MKKVSLYLFGAIFSFFIFVIVLAPVRPIWAIFGTQLMHRVPELSLTSINGTIWTGAAAINYQHFPQSKLSWQIHPLDMLKNQITADVKIDGDGHKIEGAFDSALIHENNNFKLSSINGHINSDYINAISESLGLTFSGAITLDNIDIRFSQQKIHAVNGHIAWAGGTIISQGMAFTLPPLVGELSTQDGLILLNIHHDDTTLLLISLNSAGWVKVSVKSQLFKLAGLSLPGNIQGTKPQTPNRETNITVLEFEEKLL